MCKKKDYVIVYVFGPQRSHEKYVNNQLLKRQSGEWVKIGQTTLEVKDGTLTREMMKEAALIRCKQESRTGISDWCDIYDVFAFPNNSKKVDDIIRNLLCNDIYNLENSKEELKSSTSSGDIAPGKEFVYGICRNNIKHAVESYDHSLIVNSTVETLPDIQKVCLINDIIIDGDEELPANTTVDYGKKQIKDVDMILSPGDVVYLTDNKRYKVLDADGQQITAVYVGNRRYEYDGKKAFSSKLAMELINTFGCGRVEGQKPNYTIINGNNCWTNEDGKSLTELFEENNI